MIKTPLSTAIGGVGMYTKNSLIIGGGKTEPPFDPKSLFENGEQGVWLDPSDLSTMFQDAAGTVPVTGAGQPVGLMLDKSKGLVMGPEKVTNGDFAAGTQGWVLTGNTTVSAAGARLTGLAAESTIAQNLDLEVGKTYKISASVTQVSGSLTITVPTAARFTGSIIFTAASAETNLYFRCFGSIIPADVTISNISVREVQGNHAYQATSASRPILRKNATTGAYYLEFDGTDDFLQTNSIDFTATDKVSLFTGLRKLRDSPAESILELGVLPYDGVGTFWLTTNALAPGDVWLAIAQAWNARTGFSKVIPVANNFIFSAKLDFAGSVATDEVKPRLNGSTAGFTRGLGEHAGTGNFGNHPMYIGSRTGTSLQFNGHIYSLIGVGRLVTDAETKALEKELAKRTGVTLNV